MADSGAGAGGIDQIIFAFAVTSGEFAIVNGGTVQMACFAAGTLIETRHGSAPVQSLAVGDEAQTLHGGVQQRSVCVGSRTVDCRRHMRPEMVWPVRIERGEFGENVPGRDRFIASDHATYIVDALIPAKLLVNCSTITQIEGDRIVYHHIEPEQHDIILSRGVPRQAGLTLAIGIDSRPIRPLRRILNLRPDCGKWRVARRSCRPVTRFARFVGSGRAGQAGGRCDGRLVVACRRLTGSRRTGWSCDCDRNEPSHRCFHDGRPSGTSMSHETSAACGNNGVDLDSPGGTGASTMQPTGRRSRAGSEPASATWQRAADPRWHNRKANVRNPSTRARRCITRISPGHGGAAD